MSHSITYVRLTIPDIWSEDVIINNRLKHKTKYCFENIVITSNEKTIEVMADKKLCLNSKNSYEYKCEYSDTHCVWFTIGFIFR